MKRQKVILLPPYNEPGKQHEIMQRLEQFLYDQRIDRLSKAFLGFPYKEAEQMISVEDVKFLAKEASPTKRDQMKIRRRVETLIQRRKAANGVTHLKPEEVEKLSAARGEIATVVAKSEAWADEVAAELHSDFPWLSSATELLWYALRRSAKNGTPIKVAPLIINGPPGCGKTRLTRRFVELALLPSVMLDASTGSPGFNLVGIERGWSSAQPGRPVELILSSRAANGVIVVDELCKAKTTESSKGKTYSFHDSLLSLLEPESARRWECPCFRVSFDLSHLSWIFTSNDVDLLPDTIKSRCKVVHARHWTPLELQQFVIRRGRELCLSNESIEAILVAAIHAAQKLKRRLSLRDVARMLERAQSIENKPFLH